MKRLFWNSRRAAPITEKYCCICKKVVGEFAPYRGGWKEAPALLRLLNVVGSDLDHFACPSCTAHDRERHLYLYFDRLDLWKSLRGKAVLHFAPEKRLTRMIGDAAPSRYVRADLFPTNDSIEKVDMLGMPFSAASFDWVIANHVLEHVADDMKALAEVVRVLKPGGMAVLQTPFSARLQHTLQDPGIDDGLARLEIYGQEDHVRLYGADIFERFASAGLRPDIRQHAETLPDIDPDRFGVNPQEPFFRFLKE